MTTNYTPNFNLALPDFRSGPWHDLLNGDITKIDQLLYGAISRVDTPLWANNTFYDVGVTALDGDTGSSWMCNTAHTSAATGTFSDDRAAHPTYWVQLLTGFAPRGEWQHNTNYFPYDLAYQGSTGVFALCEVRHVSNAAGSILDDEAYWSFLVDFSTANLTTAALVSYTPASRLTATNVQSALDQIESQIISLNNVNITQGTNISNNATAITNLQNKDVTHETRMTNIESVNTSQASTLTSLQSQVTAVQNQVNAMPPPFPSGTCMLFYQANPPTGWTRLALSDYGVRIVSDTSGGTGGGSLGFNTVFARTASDSHVLSLAEIPSHGHSFGGGYLVIAGGSGMGAPGGWDFGGSGSVGAAGGGAGHTHPMDMRLKYVNVHIGQKT